MARIRSAVTITVFALVATGIASANTLTGFQTTSGSFADFTDPPTSSTSVSFNQFNQAAADAAVAGACPVGFACSTAVLFQIDLSLTGTGSGNITLSNGTGSNANLGCIVVSGSPCDDSTGGVLSNGVGIADTLTFRGTDPNSNLVFNRTGNTFLVATNFNDSGSFEYLLPNGSSSFSGSNPVNINRPDIYDSTHDASWIADSAAYRGLGSVTINFALTAGYSDEFNPTGVTNPVNSAGVSNGSVSAKYLYQFTETDLSGAPEPTTLFLMGSALVGVGLIRKRIVSK